tara:strand:- start:162 stop:434 length:273 start_codon:yes stop_codon:yes gene_type:complete
MINYSDVYYSGRVQGVGFRHQVFTLAKGYECTGWVKNLADGRVQVYVEGAETEISEFINAISDELDAFIRDQAQESGLSKRQFQKFSIVA